MTDDQSLKSLGFRPIPQASGPKSKKGLEPTVANFILVLTSKVTQFDKRLDARQPNIYRLGHYLNAVQEIRDGFTPSGLQESGPQAMVALKGLMKEAFEDDFPPRRAVQKQIDAYLTTGKRPSLVGK